MDTYNKIKWIASYPKSGNTWIRMFLNSYVYGGDLNINGFQQYVWNDLQPTFMQQLCPVPLNKLSVEEQYLYHPATLNNIIQNFPIRCLKTHNAKIAINYIPAIPLTISDKVLYIVRDPRDICISIANHFNYSIDAAIEFMGNISQGIEFREAKLVHILLTWSDHITSWTDKNDDLDFFVVTFEELLKNPLDIFTDILKFLDIPYESDRMVHALEQTTFDNLSILEDIHGFIEAPTNCKFFRYGKAGVWKDVLTNGQADKIESDHGEMMQNYGYI
ncbi:MAG: sulfotransferase domain-containing protein [Nitrososphaeraceae archaeon]|nr:sulfotransferase domain-containing protein [Nitrososphaeraceae archaeon]